jgi:tetratricopeptide (TPR) repeat protein
MVPAYAYSYLLLMHVGRFDPVVAWVIGAWQRTDYESALFRLRLFSFCGNRAPFRALMLSAANRADQAYSIATTVTLVATDMEEPSYNLDFAAGRAALALGDLVRARRHFENLYERFPGSALARYALGDDFLWERLDPARAHELLTSVLADSDRNSLPHWKQLGECLCGRQVSSDDYSGGRRTAQARRYGRVGPYSPGCMARGFERARADRVTVA